MGQVSDTLITFTEAVISHFDLQFDDFDKIQEIIMDNNLPLVYSDIVDFFTTKIVCPHCLSLDGPTCNCTALERL